MSIIRKKRVEKEWSRRQLANRLGVNEQVVVRWERKEQVPTIFDVKIIYKVLKINFRDLLNDYINKEGKTK